jgi:hypothetical protein
VRCTGINACLSSRVLRLLFLPACYHCGIEAWRYLGLQGIIELNLRKLKNCARRTQAGPPD